MVYCNLKTICAVSLHSQPVLVKTVGVSLKACEDALVCLFDLGLTSLSTFFSHIATVSGCGRELNAHF